MYPRSQTLALRASILLVISCLFFEFAETATAQQRAKPTPTPTPSSGTAQKVERSLEKFFGNLNERFPTQRNVDSARGARQNPKTTFTPNPPPTNTPRPQTDQKANQNTTHQRRKTNQDVQSNQNRTITAQITPPSQVTQLKESSPESPSEEEISLPRTSLPKSELQTSPTPVPQGDLPKVKENVLLLATDSQEQDRTSQKLNETAVSAPIRSIQEENSKSSPTPQEKPTVPAGSPVSIDEEPNPTDNRKEDISQENISALQTPSPTTELAPTPTPLTVSTIPSSELIEYESLPEAAKKIIDSALSVTSLNLPYVFGGNTPQAGGLDCSGFVQYTLTQAGIKNVPRQSDQQYVWLRRNTQIFPVMSDKLSSFEFDELRPSDLLFWSATYNPSQEREFQITHSMIYLGMRKSDGKPLMAGASSGRTFNSVPQHGSSVFDFILPRRASGRSAEGTGGSRFVGYGPIPGVWQPGEREKIPRIK